METKERMPLHGDPERIRLMVAATVGIQYAPITAPPQQPQHRQQEQRQRPLL
jgi:hypothetical protein